MADFCAILINIELQSRFVCKVSTSLFNKIIQERRIYTKHSLIRQFIKFVFLIDQRALVALSIAP